MRLLAPRDSTDDLAERYRETFSQGGALAVKAGAHRLYVEGPCQIESVRASVGTAPAGAAILVDVNRNGTTVFTTQTNRPSVPDAGFTGVSTTIENGALVAGDYLTVDVDQVGSTTAGADLTVTVAYRRTT